VTRRDGRQPDELRPLEFQRDYTEFAAGSVLVSMGRTKVLCTASVDEKVPPWMRGRGTGWVTAEYSMLPGSTAERSDREVARGRPSGRTQEIQRLIGRSLRAVTDFAVMGEMQVVVDCDVLQADGGTRTASISGAYVALHDAFSRMEKLGRIRAHPLTAACAAVLDAAISASNSRGSSPSSGFHCTPRPHRCPCTSSASTTWSGVQAAVSRSVPIRLIAWWWAAGT